MISRGWNGEGGISACGRGQCVPVSAPLFTPVYVGGHGEHDLHTHYGLCKIRQNRDK